MGQDLALQQFTNAVCDHLLDPHPTRPLTISVHGPTGVGKSMLHQQAARVLYSSRPHDAHLKCPGQHCKAYKVIFGVNFDNENIASQQMALRQSIEKHLSLYPDSFLVIEEYDKLDCSMRQFFRQMFESWQAIESASMNRAVVVLESNVGFLKIYEEAKKDRNQIDVANMTHTLKDTVFEHWVSDDCEPKVNTQKMVRRIDHFLPFFPLQRKHIEHIFEIRLQKISDSLHQQKLGELHWDKSVLEFLSSKVEYDGTTDFAVDGGTEVSGFTTAYVTGPVRQWRESQNKKLQEYIHSDLFDPDLPEPVGSGQLVVAGGGKNLAIEEAR